MQGKAFNKFDVFINTSEFGAQPLQLWLINKGTHSTSLMSLSILVNLINPCCNNEKVTHFDYCVTGI